MCFFSSTRTLPLNLALYYKTSFNYRTCVRRAPPRPMRKCFVALLSKNMNCARPHCNPTPSDTLCPKDHTSHFIHTPLFTLHAPHFTLHISHLALHTPHFISSHLISSHFISFYLISSHWALLTSSHLISALLSSSHFISSRMSSKFFSTIFISSEHCSKFSSHRSSSALLYVSKLLLSERNSSTHTKPLRAEHCGWFQYSKIALLVIHLQGENSRPFSFPIAHTGLHHKLGMLQLFPCDASQTKVQIASYNQSQSTVHVVQRPKLMGYLCNWGCRWCRWCRWCQVQVPEARAFYGFQIAMENIHSERAGGVPADGVGHSICMGGYGGENHL